MRFTFHWSRKTSPTTRGLGHPILELRYRQRDGDTSANERTNDGTDEDLNDGSNVAPAFAEGANGTHEPNMSPISEESSGVMNGYTMRASLESVAMTV